MHKGRTHYTNKNGSLPGSRTTSIVDPCAVMPGGGKTGLRPRMDPKPVTPLAIEKAAERNRDRKPPQHTRASAAALIARIEGK